MQSKYIINWELSLACNLDCSFCSQKERRDKNNIILPSDNIFKIIGNLPPNSHISFLGGETFIFPNIIEIFKKLEKNGITYEITTNGILLEKYLPQFRELKNLLQINISIDGYGEFHDNSRGKKGLFSTLKKIIPKLLEIKKISVSTVVTEQLENNNLIKLHLWLNNLGIKEHKLIYMMNFSVKDVEQSKTKIKNLGVGLPGNNKINNSELKNDFLDKLAILKNLKTNTQIKIEPIALFKKGNISCKQLDKQLRIDQNGKLSICEFITNNFDDISEIKLDEAIKNNEFLDFKNDILNNFPLDICKTCCKLYNK